MNGLRQSSRPILLCVSYCVPSQSFYRGRFAYHRLRFCPRIGVIDRLGCGGRLQYSSKAVVEQSAGPLKDLLDSAAVSPTARYNELVKAGSLRDDSQQRYVADRLQVLHDELINYNPSAISLSEKPSILFSRIFSSSSTQSATIPIDRIPRGLYLYGDVGTGKSMLMDLFYATLPYQIKSKRRIHFHAFMVDVHKRIHNAKTKLGLAGGDAVVPVAKDLANEATILCFDEFQVTDIADAMILRRLLESLLNYGVVFVMTSNRHPDELYKNGIQRSSFIPAIELIKERLDIINLDSGTDYRRIERALSNCFYHPLSEENKAEIEEVFKAFVQRDGGKIEYNRQLSIWGRTLSIPECSTSTAKFNFRELCGQPLSAADYLEVTKTYKSVFVLDIPKMDLGEKDMARRFITFIDACYESKTKLFCSSEVPIYEIFTDGSETSSNENEKVISDHMRSVMDDLGLPASVATGSSIFTGDDEIFAFARCCSRLYEMSSREWAGLSNDKQ